MPVTIPTQMRLGAETLEQIDDLLHREPGLTRTQLVRRLVAEAHRAAFLNGSPRRKKNRKLARDSG